MIGVGLGVSLLGIINRRPLIITGYTDMTHLNQYSGIDQRVAAPQDRRQRFGRCPGPASGAGSRPWSGRRHSEPVRLRTVFDSPPPRNSVTREPAARRVVFRARSDPYARRARSRVGLLPAPHGDDDGVVHGDDVNRTFRAVFVGVVARWSARRRAVVVELARVIVTVAPDRGRARAPRGPVLSRRAGAAAASG